MYIYIYLYHTHILHCTLYTLYTTSVYTMYYTSLGAKIFGLFQLACLPGWLRELGGVPTHGSRRWPGGAQEPGGPGPEAEAGVEVCVALCAKPGTFFNLVPFI